MIFLPEKKKIISPFGKVISPFSDLVSVPKARHFMADNAMRAASGIGAAGDEISYKFDGTGDYLSIPNHADWDFGGGDWTIDFWAYWNVFGDGKGLLEYNQDSSNRWLIATTGASDVYTLGESTGNDWTATTSGAGISTGSWIHIAAIRNGSAVRVYVNGVEKGIDTSITDMPSITGTLYIGRKTANNDIDGYIDELRISKGIARWTSNFTPPTKQYESDANTKLLIHCGEEKSGTTGSGATFTDSGNTGHTVTENGNAIEETTIVKF